MPGLIPPTDLDRTLAPFPTAFPVRTTPEPWPGEDAWRRAEVASLDIFDTALVRAVAEPADLHLVTHAFLPADLLRMDPGEFAARRQRAEAGARLRQLAATASPEVTLEQIHAEFAHEAGWSEAIVHELVTAERAAELTLCRAHPGALRLWRAAVDAGRPVVFLSDTWHTADFLAELLRKAGYDVRPDAIFASCEHQAGKADGTLFEAARTELGWASKRWIHIGDNEACDVAGARRAGVGGYAWPHGTGGRARVRTGAAVRRRAETLVLGVREAAAAGAAQDFWTALGWRVFGPLLCGYALWLRARFRELGARRALFLLRDGWVVGRVYSLCRDNDPTLPEAHLLPASRRAFGLASLGCPGVTDTDFLVVSAHDRPAREFLERLDVPAAPLARAFLEAGFRGPDDVVELDAGPQRVLRLMRHPLVLAALHRRALVERSLLLRFLDQEGCLAEDPVALVDLGWNATIEKALRQILAADGRCVKLRAHYLATFARAADPLVPRQDFVSYLCHAGDPFPVAETLASFREFFELFCTMPAGSLRHFARREGRVEPVHDPAESGPAQNAAVAAVQAGAEQYARAFFPVARQCRVDRIPPEVAAAEAFRVITAPTPEEARMIGALEFGEGMGSARRRTVLPQRGSPAGARCIWHAGAAALRNAAPVRA